MNNPYMQEKFLEQTQREQSQAIENNRLLAQAKECEHAAEPGQPEQLGQPGHPTQGILGQCGSLLIALGTRLERIEQRHLHSQA